jgi:hypothetical protein
MKDKIKEKLIFDLNPISDPLGKGRKLLPFTYINNDEDRATILRIKEVIDKTTDMLFISFKNELLSEPITYIISAVWGKIKHGELSKSQNKIYNTIDSMIIEIMETLEFDELNDTQKFAIEYLIRGLVISKITYLIEAFKNSSWDEINSN